MNSKKQSLIFKGVIVFALVLSVMFSAPSLFDGSVFANNPPVCPDSDGWEKVEGLASLSYTHTLAENSEFLIAEWCYQAGSVVNYGTVSTPSKSVTVTSTVLNPQEKCCRDLSHASFRLVKDEKKDNLDPLTLTGECLGEQIILVNAATIKWTVTNPNDESISFSWSANNSENGNGNVPAKSSTTFTTNGDGDKVTLFYDLGESSTQTELEIEVCETKEEPEDPEPDQPAGGVGPSTINPTTFFLIGLAGLGMVSAFFFKKVNITR